MAFQTWLPAALRAAGLAVVEEPGWAARSAAEDPDASTFRPAGLVAHHTGGGPTSTVAGEVRTLVDGRPGLSGPIAQLFLSRAGVWHVVAAGLCHHVKVGWGGLLAGRGNSTLVGVEAQHSGGTEPWTTVQYRSYVAGVAAVCARMGWDPASRVVGHREHQPGDKPDPTFDLHRFRRDVTAAMSDGGDMGLEDMVVPLPAAKFPELNGQTEARFASLAGYEAGRSVQQAARMERLMADVGQLLARPACSPAGAEPEVLRAMVAEAMTDALPGLAAAVAAELRAVLAAAGRGLADAVEGDG